MESEGERKKEQSSIKGPLSIMYENKHAHEEYTKMLRLTLELFLFIKNPFF